MRTLEEQAIGTQNYFFLRLAAGREVDEIMIDELDPFLESLGNEIATLKPNIKDVMKTELDEGDYFRNKPFEQVTRMLNGASARITGSTMSSITDFYLTLHEEILKDEGIEHHEGFNEKPTNA